MRIAVVGAGAMGSVYAGLLASAGNEIWALDTWREHVNAIRRQGLRVEGASGDRRVSLHATTDPGEVGPCDLVVVATKAADVAGAAAGLEPLLGPDTAVLTIQNGLGSAERIAAVVDAERILIGVAGGFGASMQGPGHVHHNGMELLRLGEMGGGMSPRLARIESVWREAGFNVRSFSDIHQLVWEKFICNVTFSGPCAVTGRTIGELMAEPHAWRVALSCGLEAHAVGEAKGVNFSFDDAASYITGFGRTIPDARPSMLLDHLAHRPSEIDAINGMVPVLGAESGVATPVNQVIVDLIRAREAEFPRPGSQAD